MIVHIFPDQKFTSEFCKFIYASYPDNLILIYQDGNETFCSSLDKSRGLYFNDIKLLLKIKKDVILSADKIIIHSLDNYRLYLFLFIHRKILNKSVFVAWGGDIYNDFLTDGVSLKKRFIKFLKRLIKNCLGKKYVIGHFNQYMTFAYADYDYMKKKYGAHGQAFDCLYPSTINKQDLDNCFVGRKTDVKRILVGNSATDTNNHFDAFSVLERFNESNIEILCPLSYGNDNYRNEVISKGKKIFGDKFIPITEYLSPQDYSSLLSTIDVAVFYHDRQQATGNIEILSYYGAKIFIKSTITSWKHYVEREGRYFFDALKIGGMSYAEFLHFGKKEAEDNKSYFAKVWDIDYVKGKWDPICGE